MTQTKIINCSDNTQYGSAANGMTYNGRTVGSGFDVTVKRESKNTALVNVMTPNGKEDYLAAVDAEPDQNLQELAVNFASFPDFSNMQYATPEDPSWDDLAARWDAIKRPAQVETMKFAGWTQGDGTSTEGYRVEDYFDDNGAYLGPDKHGIEPIFEVEQ